MKFLVGLVIGAVIGYVVAGRRELLTLVDYRRRAGSKDQDLTREQLYERAQAADIPGRSTMNKEELLEAVEEADRSS